jgi:tetratricopeptide (TPR) repeat protein
LEEAEGQLKRAIDAAAELKHPAHHDRSQIALADIYWDREDFARAEELLLSVAQAAGRRQSQSQIDANQFTRVRATLDLVDVALERGETLKATRYLEEATRLLGQRDHARHRGYLHLVRGRMAAMGKSKNRFQAALREFRRAEATFLSLGDGHNHGLYMVCLRRAQVYLALKNVKKAMKECLRCMQFAKASRHKPRQALCLLLKSKFLLEEKVENQEGIYEEILASVGVVRNPVLLFKIISNLYLYTWDLGDQVDLTDYHLRQIHKMAEILDRETFERLYEKHVSRRVLKRALVKLFGVSPSLLMEDLDPIKD